MAPSRQLDPDFVRAHRRRLLAAVAVSTALHVVALGLWIPVGTAPAPLPVPLAAYPAAFTLADVAPAEAGGGDPAEAPSIDPERAASAPPASEVPTGVGIPVPSAEPVPDSAVYPLPAAPPPEFARLLGANAGVGGTGGGTGGGDGVGVGMGAGPGRSTSAVPPPPPTPPLVERPDRSPVPVRFSEPAYPPDARADGVRARVRVRVLVDERGRVAEARIVERLRLGRGDREEAVPSLPYGMDEAALEAARRYQFRPAEAGGLRVRSYTTITCSFGV